MICISCMKGGGHNCTEGAFRLFLKHRGGAIWQHPNHFHVYYVPQNADDETPVQNLGTIFVNEVSGGNRWEEMTLGELKQHGCLDLTTVVVQNFYTGRWELEGGKNIADLLGEIGWNRKEKRT